MARKYCLILCLLANVASIFCNLYEKNGNAYEITHGEEFASTPAPGYVKIASASLEEFKSGKAPATVLNKFNSGLEQYALYQLHEKLALELKNITGKPDLLSDPVIFPNKTGKVVSFSNINVYGLPQIRSKQPELVYDGLTSVFMYQGSIEYKSDAIILTGNFHLADNSTYFFVYSLKDVSNRIKFTLARGAITVEYFKTSLQFASEEFIHTYDSSYEKYTEINEAVTKEFYDLLRDTYSLKIFELASQHLAITFNEKDIKFAASYKEQLLSSIIESAVQFIGAKGANYFEASPINFTNSNGPRVYVQTYKDIKLEGVLNFKSNELIETKIEKIGENVNISSTIEFVYPEDGEKQAFVSFVNFDGRSENAKKFKVKNIKIIFVYNYPALNRPPQPRRNKEVFFNDSGFLIKIELDNFDPTYQFVIWHLGNDISRLIDTTLSESA